MELLYKVHNGLYVNLTNKCPCACTFCLRSTMNHVGEATNLWLEREPSAEEVIKEFSKWNVEEFDEIVFCGFGEPTEAFDVLLEVAKYIKATYKIPTRINTNGLGNLVNGKDIVPLMKGLIDTVSISLNNPDPIKYEELVRSKFGEGSFNEMISFAKECAKVLPKVVMTTVDTTISKEEEAKCQKICDEIGAKYRIRPWED
ncbi:MAG: TIGR04100 family radical SAM protein [Clostridiaceae bacterium]|nr:TIGR04100 family radical SAM protein [Clostridiaceae bacterium]